ncbi:hypothetical protein QJS10_CPA03g02384 [Acorus calamus]|uniref:Uncharacterized protein n=1 Tax=Acorus calamus TaxID=4465 RepID=A0AAV9F7R7_ACOCL|nr:hypothetical protein QJS10_CPA03g02384 [Acorus calamus]
MVAFPRSVSLPNTNPKHEKSYHVRSTSLPCRSHPTISHVEHHLTSLRSWSSKPEDTSAWLLEGLTSLETLHASVDDLLQLPQSQELLRRKSGWVDELLEDFLLFVDTYGTFKEALMSLKELHSSAQAAIRRRDGAKMGSYVKARKKTEREVLKLLPELRSIRRRALAMVFTSDVGEMELAGVLREVVMTTVEVSVSIFGGVSPSSSTSAGALKARLGFGFSHKRGEGIREVREVAAEDLCRAVKAADDDVRRVLDRLVALEDCVGELERRSEHVFRGFISTRVSLLNILTP